MRENLLHQFKEIDLLTIRNKEAINAGWNHFTADDKLNKLRIPEKEISKFIVLDESIRTMHTSKPPKSFAFNGEKNRQRR